MGRILDHMGACLDSEIKIVILSISVFAGILLQMLASALSNNGWLLILTMILLYVLLPMPLIFLSGSGWVGAARFWTGLLLVGNIAIPTILKHADVIGWGSLAMVLSSFFIFILAILYTIKLNYEDDEYTRF
ncbi:hypothetical protein MKW98_000886 [Papaver atlanticum]|uniref:Vacuolar protein sorting 55 n=1 Tax=Papaver atlanticum TaxID=357466 RepID=A0AAD4SFG9_9MAGN|nr:hypothetical protein MKW98_000886 [Papaver atlanticum]